MTGWLHLYTAPDLRRGTASGTALYAVCTHVVPGPSVQEYCSTVGSLQYIPSVRLGLGLSYVHTRPEFSLSVCLFCSLESSGLERD